MSSLRRRFRAAKTARLVTFVLPLVALLTLSQGVMAQSAASQYSVTALGSFQPTAINRSGNVVGYGGHFHAFFWSQGVTTDLGTMGGSDAVAYGLNDAGQIVGVVNTPHGLDTFIYTNGSVLDLNQPTNSYYGNGINSRGDVASNRGGATPYLYSNGVVQYLDMGGCAGEIGIDVNDSDVVVGDGGGGPCDHQSSIVWSGGNFRILPSPPGALYTQPFKINAGGQIVGFSSGPRPVIWQPDNAGGWTVVDLGVPTGADDAYADGINNLGVVVGGLDSALYGNHGFVWDPTDGIQDLNSLIAPGSGMVLGQASAINDLGQIIVLFSDGTGYLLTPVSPVNELQNLITSTLLTNLASNVQSQLDAKLNAALASLDAAKKNSSSTAANQLQAFVNAVSADVQSGRLTCSQATPLVNAAQTIVASLQQPPLSVSLPCQ